MASVLIAQLLAGDGFFGPQQGAEVVADCAVGRFYGDAPAGREDRRNEAITVDGRPAWMIESHLTFDIPDIRTTGELMIIVVVDTVRSRACSTPRSPTPHRSSWSPPGRRWLSSGFPPEPCQARG